jgi:hypothetical protein
MFTRFDSLRGVNHADSHLANCPAMGGASASFQEPSGAPFSFFNFPQIVGFVDARRREGDAMR